MLQYPKHLVKFQTSHQNSKMAAEMFEKFTSLFTSNLSVKAEEEEEEEEEEEVIFPNLHLDLYYCVLLRY